MNPWWKMVEVLQQKFQKNDGNDGKMVENAVFSIEKNVLIDCVHLLNDLFQ